MIVSALGTWSYNVAIAVYAYQQTHSTVWVAAATVGRYVPALFITWFGNAWVARFPRRTTAVATDVFCAVVMGLLTAVALAGGPLPLAIALAALSSGVARIQSAATLAVAADVIPEGRLLRSMANLSSADAVATAVGPALASAILLRWNPAVVFALNGVTFALSAMLLAGLKGVPAGRGREPGRQPAAEVEDSIWRSVRPLLVTRTVAGMVYGFDVVLLAVIATEQLRRATAGYGWLLAAAGAGGIVAATLLRAGRAGERVTRGVVAGMALYTVPLALFVASPDVAGGLAIQLVRGLGSVLVTATIVTHLQRSVPSSAAGSVFAAAHSLLLGGTAAGAVLAPVVLHVLGLDGALVLMAVLPMIVVLAAVPGLRSFDREESRLIAALDPRVSVLRGLALFQDASRSTLIELAEGVRERTVPAGTVVVAEGEDSDALYVLAAGEVEVTTVRAGSDGEIPVRLRTLAAPAYFGEIGLIHGVARTATVTTSTASLLWRIPASSFLDAAVQAGFSGALTESVRVRLGASAWPSGAPVASEL